MVCWSGFSNCWKLGIHYSNLLVWLIFDKSWNICKDLYRSVQIRTETFLKLQIRGVFFRRALFNQLISFSKTEFMTIQFSNNPGISVRGSFRGFRDVRGFRCFRGSRGLRKINAVEAVV